MTFEWDAAKAVANKAKHGVSFRAATKVFFDPCYVEHHDGGDHAEDRYVAFGLVRGRVLLVVYTMRDKVIRLISAREAPRHEATHYWKNRSLYH
ncbi:BrnT family toxin [Luteibacter yeojuensis]|uniref:BrnT family toxin n=1 Tax=Luteibacter yeojuensis TaxID=345309 RepID=A0A7X5TQ47_9GAMM|nr:BrnT family toxin [Luteibacter yeojuensis]